MALSASTKPPQVEDLSWRHSGESGSSFRGVGRGRGGGRGGRGGRSGAGGTGRGATPAIGVARGGRADRSDDGDSRRSPLQGKTGASPVEPHPKSSIPEPGSAKLNGAGAPPAKSKSRRGTRPVPSLVLDPASPRSPIAQAPATAPALVGSSRNRRPSQRTESSSPALSTKEPSLAPSDTAIFPKVPHTAALPFKPKDAPPHLSAAPDITTFEVRQSVETLVERMRAAAMTGPRSTSPGSHIDWAGDDDDSLPDLDDWGYGGSHKAESVPDERDEIISPILEGSLKTLPLLDPAEVATPTGPESAPASAVDTPTLGPKADKAVPPAPEDDLALPSASTAGDAEGATKAAETVNGDLPTPRPADAPPPKEDKPKSRRATRTKSVSRALQGAGALGQAAPAARSVTAVQPVPIRRPTKVAEPAGSKSSVSPISSTATAPEPVVRGKLVHHPLPSKPASAVSESPPKSRAPIRPSPQASVRPKPVAETELVKETAPASAPATSEEAAKPSKEDPPTEDAAPPQGLRASMHAPKAASLSVTMSTSAPSNLSSHLSTSPTRPFNSHGRSHSRPPPPSAQKERFSPTAASFGRPVSVAASAHAPNHGRTQSTPVTPSRMGGRAGGGAAGHPHASRPVISNTAMARLMKTLGGSSGGAARNPSPGHAEVASSEN